MQWRFQQLSMPIRDLEARKMWPGQFMSSKPPVWPVVTSKTRNSPKGAVKRAHKYLDAGADAIFPEALQSAEEFRDFAKQVKAPLLANMTEFGKSPLLSFQELADFGYKMVIFPQSAFRVSMKATEEFLHDLKKAGTQSGWINKMQTRQQLYELLD